MVLEENATVLLYTYTVITLGTEWSGVFFRQVIHIARLTPKRKPTCHSEVGRKLLKKTWKLCSVVRVRVVGDVRAKLCS